jgi:hypothetical protein
MSVSRVQQWRWRVVEAGNGLSPIERLVALDLSIHMNGSGNCDPAPSIKTIAEEAGIDYRVVIRALRSLEDAGYLLVHRHRDRRGNRYSAAFSGAEKVPPGTVPSHARDGTVPGPTTVPSHARDGTVPAEAERFTRSEERFIPAEEHFTAMHESAHRRGTTEGELLKGEVQEQTATPSRRALARRQTATTSDAEIAARFEEFWVVYPIHRDRKRAEKAWLKAARRASPEIIIAGAIAYRDDPGRDPTKTKYAEGWLNGDRWEDEPTPASNNGRRPTPGLRSLQVAQAAKAVGR